MWYRTAEVGPGVPVFAGFAKVSVLALGLQDCLGFKGNVCGDFSFWKS